MLTLIFTWEMKLQVIKSRFGVLFVLFILLFTQFSPKINVSATGGRHGGLSDVDVILNSNFTIWTFGGHAGEGDVQNIHALAQAGIKFMHIEGWWSEFVSNPLEVYYNETIRTWAKESINFSLYGILPSYEGGPQQVASPIDPNDIWGITLGDEEPGWIGYSDFHETVSPKIAKYNETYHSETGYYLKPLYDMNNTERFVFTEWLCIKSNWVYNYMHDYVKSQVPHAMVFQYTMMVPVWGKSEEICAAYELKANGHAMDCYYALQFPWLLYETVRRYKTSMPDKEFHFDIWGTIWDFLNEAGDGLYYKEGSWEQIRRETWLSYLSGVDVLGYFDWAPQNNDSYDWRWGHQRTDDFGRRLWRYIDNFAGQLDQLPILKPNPEVLVIGCGYQTDQAMMNVADLGLFTEYDLVNQRCFALTEIDLSNYSLILLTDGWYYNSTIEKLEAYVENGGSLIFLGGVRYADGAPSETERFSFEGDESELDFAGHIRLNITLPNPLDLELVYEGILHSGKFLRSSSLTANHHSIPGFYEILGNGTPVEIGGHHLLLYHNESAPESGWILYFGAAHSSTDSEANWDTYSQNPQNDLWFLYQTVVRAFARMLNITNSISTPETMNALITQGVVDEDSIMAGIYNFENVDRQIPYTLDLSQFGFPSGNYWVHSLDENISLGQFHSDNQILTLDVDLISNGTRLLLISQTQQTPNYWIDVFPPIPEIEPPIITTITTPTTTTSITSQDLDIFSIAVIIVAAGSVFIIAVVLFIRKPTNE